MIESNDCLPVLDVVFKLDQKSYRDTMFGVEYEAELCIRILDPVGIRNVCVCHQPSVYSDVVFSLLLLLPFEFSVSPLSDNDHSFTRPTE